MLHYFRASKKFGGEGGRYQDFPSTVFCLTVPTKISVRESFIVALLSGIEKVWRRGGEVSRFSVNSFLSHSADENFRTQILYCCISFGYRKSLEKRGGGVGREYQVFPFKSFCLTVPKISVRESFTVALIFLEGGVSKFSVENFLSHSDENFRRGILYCCINYR